MSALLQAATVEQSPSLQLSPQCTLYRCWTLKTSLASFRWYLPCFNQSQPISARGGRERKKSQTRISRSHLKIGLQAQTPTFSWSLIGWHNHFSQSEAHLKMGLKLRPLGTAPIVSQTIPDHIKSSPYCPADPLTFTHLLAPVQYQPRIEPV